MENVEEEKGRLTPFDGKELQISQRGGGRNEDQVQGNQREIHLKPSGDQGHPRGA